MLKTLVSLTERQMENLTKRSKVLGISKSELLRRIMDRYLDSGKPIVNEDVLSESRIVKVNKKSV